MQQTSEPVSLQYLQMINFLCNDQALNTVCTCGSWTNQDVNQTAVECRIISGWIRTVKHFHQTQKKKTCISVTCECTRRYNILKNLRMGVIQIIIKYKSSHRRWCVIPPSTQRVSEGSGTEHDVFRCNILPISHYQLLKRTRSVGLYTKRSHETQESTLILWVPIKLS